MSDSSILEPAVAETEAVAAVGHLRTLRPDLVELVKQPVTYPDSSPMLDLESREGDRARQIRHIHQLCIVHSWHYVAATRIKLAYLVEGYLAMTDQGNPIGMYALARPILELRVAVFQLARALDGAIASQQELVQRGVDAFQVIVRTRFATKDPRLRKQFRDVGLPDSQMGKPTLKGAIDVLSREPGTEWISEHYDLLCDYVHHNLPSTRPAISAVPFGARATSDRGTIITPEEGTQVTYMYRAPIALADAIERTARQVLSNATEIVDALTRLSESPYSPAELFRETGSSSGR